MDQDPRRTAANEVYRLPPPLFDARCKACWFVVSLALLVVLSFWSLDLQWAQFFSRPAIARMGRFMAELLTPATDSVFLAKLLPATLETLAMSVVGTLLAAGFGLLLALPAARTWPGDKARWRGASRLLLNALRSVPELMWAALLLIAAGLGPFAGTLALAIHTTGVLGRLFAEAIENAPEGPAFALRVRGVGEGALWRREAMGLRFGLRDGRCALNSVLHGRLLGQHRVGRRCLQGHRQKPDL